MTIFYQDKIWTRILLERLAEDSIGTYDAQHFAFKQIRLMNCHGVASKFKKLVDANMKQKLIDAKENENDAKHDMVQSSIELKKLVNINTVAGMEFKQFVDYSWNKCWNTHKEKVKNKVERLKNKQKEKLEEIKYHKNKSYNKNTCKEKEMRELK